MQHKQTKNNTNYQGVFNRSLDFPLIGLFVFHYFFYYVQEVGGGWYLAFIHHEGSGTILRNIDGTGLGFNKGEGGKMEDNWMKTGILKMKFRR